MYLPHHMLFLSTLTLGTMMTMSTSHWLFLWTGLELNTMSFIALLSSEKKTPSTESSVKYFIIQATSSALFLTAGLSSQTPTHHILAPTFIMMSIFMKLGASPFHFWLPPVASSMNWDNLLILTTWQKVAPLAVLHTTMKWTSTSLPLLIAILSTLTGGLGGIGQTQLRPIIAFSSIGHLGWIIALSCTSPATMIFYFMVYTTLLSPLLIMLKKMNIYSPMHDKMSTSNKSFIILAALLLSLGGTPPLSGFMLKWISIHALIKSFNPMYIMPMILGSLMSLYFYLNILFSSINFSTAKPTNTTPPFYLLSMSLTSLLLTDLLIMLTYALA